MDVFRAGFGEADRYPFVDLLLGGLSFELLVSVGEESSQESFWFVGNGFFFFPLG